MPEEDSGFMRVCMTMHAGRGGEEAVRRGPPRLGDAIPEVHQRAPRRRGEGRGVTKEGVRRQNAPVPEPRRLDAQTARDRAQLAAPGEGQLGAVSTVYTPPDSGDITVTVGRFSAWELAKAHAAANDTVENNFVTHW